MLGKLDKSRDVVDLGLSQRYPPPGPLLAEPVSPWKGDVCLSTCFLASPVARALKYKLDLANGKAKSFVRLQQS